MTRDLDVTVLIPCEWCDAYDLDKPLIALAHGQLNLCVECYYHDYCVPCRLCDALMEPDEIDERFMAVVEETPGFPHGVQPGVYEVLRTPYYIEPLIGQGRLWPDQLRLAATLTPFDDGEPPCGDLCERCRIDALDGWSQVLEKHVSELWSW